MRRTRTENLGESFPLGTTATNSSRRVHTTNCLSRSRALIDCVCVYLVIEHKRCHQRKHPSYQRRQRAKTTHHRLLRPSSRLLQLISLTAPIGGNHPASHSTTPRIQFHHPPAEIKKRLTTSPRVHHHPLNLILGLYRVKIILQMTTDSKD